MRHCPACDGYQNFGTTCTVCVQLLVPVTVRECDDCHRQYDSAVDRCPDCHHDLVAVDAKTCAACGGLHDSAMMFCPGCNGELDEADARYCPGCQAHFEDNELIECPDCGKLRDVAARQCPKCLRQGVTSFSKCPVCVEPTEEVQGKRCKLCGKVLPPTASRCDVCDNAPLQSTFEKYCATCRKLCPPFEDKCPVCGRTPLETAKKCSRCGRPAPPSDEICLSCGELEPDTPQDTTSNTRKHAREDDSEIEITAQAAALHEVKGTRRGSPPVFCVQVRHETVKWTDHSAKEPQAYTFERPTFVEARVKRTTVGKRKQPPIPLSAIELEEIDAAEEGLDETAGEDAGEGALGEDQIAEVETGPGTTEEEIKTAEEAESKLGGLQDFDKGHLVALFLGGVDNSWEIVPQVRDVNRGSWLAMESEIYDFAKDAGTLATNAGLLLGGLNTLAQKSVQFKIAIYYADQDGSKGIGDPRIPVCFYVQVYIKVGGDQRPIAHYLIANRSRNVSPYPQDHEIQLFKLAHKALGLELPEPAEYTSGAKARDYEELAMDFDEVDDKETYLEQGPYKALQWLHDTGRLVVVAGFMAAAYNSSAIALVRKYNRWVHGGKLRSDGAAEYKDEPWNEGELPDPFPDLDESSGQAYPEVDHIVPKKKGGENSYANGRLVSFALNHIYREKPDPPDRTWDHLPKLKEKYSDEALRDTPVRVSGEAAQMHSWGIQQRRTYLRRMEARHEICRKRTGQAQEFEFVRDQHNQGCNDFFTFYPAGLKDAIELFGFQIPHQYRGGRKSYLRDISDEIPGLSK